MITNAQDFYAWEQEISMVPLPELPFGDGETGNGLGDNLEYEQEDQGSADYVLLCVDADDLSSVAINAVCRMQP